MIGEEEGQVNKSLPFSSLGWHNIVYYRELLRLDFLVDGGELLMVKHFLVGSSIVSLVEFQK